MQPTPIVILGIAFLAAGCTVVAPTEEQMVVAQTSVPEYTDDYGRKVYDYYDVPWR